MASTKSPLSPLGDLGKLPAELRNEIYRHALTPEQPIELSRARIKNPKYDKGENKKLPTWDQQPKTIFHCRSLIQIKTGKRICKVHAARALAVHLVEASKVIRAEARPILFGGNTFKFENASTVAIFAETVRNALHLITRVSCHYDAMWGGGRKWLELSRISGLKSFEVCVDPYTWSRTTSRSADDAAQAVWRYIKPMIASEYIGVHGLHVPPHLNHASDLPEELQRLRLRRFHFPVNELMYFARPGMPREFVEDAQERNTRFRALVLDQLKSDAETIRKIVDGKQARIDRMLREARAKKQ